MFEAKSIMKKDVFTVKPDTSLYETMHTMINQKISGMPVVDDEKRLVGIISEKDVMVLLLRKSVSESDKVGDYMTKQVTCFGPNDSAADIAEFFIRNPVRRVPIIEDGKLAGIISRRDIVALILKIRGHKG